MIDSLELSVGRSVIDSLCPAVTFALLFATACFNLRQRRIMWRHSFVAVCTLDLLRWMAVSLES